MINREAGKEIGVLTPKFYDVPHSGAVPHENFTPYGQWLRNFDNMLADIESRKEDLEGYDPDGELEYADHVKKAFDDAKNGEDRREAMRLLIPLFVGGMQEDPNMIYDEIPTPREGKAIFMKMGEEQFGELDLKEERYALGRLWSRVHLANCPEEFQQPYIHVDEKVLEALDREIWGFMVTAESPLAHTTKGEDIKYLYVLLKLQDMLNEKLYGRADVTSDEKKEIDEQRAKLSEKKP